MKRPNFLCVGAQKAGTTTLHNCLSQHPEIYLPGIKETKFFINPEHSNDGIDYYSKEYYSEVNQEKVIGEIDPDYLFFDSVPERLKNTLGVDIKLLIILRNPMDRAYSHYLMSVRNGYENKSFKDAVLLEKKRIKEGYLEYKRFSYVSRGAYFEQVKNFLTHFQAENIRVYLFEKDVIGRLDWLLKDACSFLNVNPNFNFTLEKKNPAQKIRFKQGHELIYNDNLIKSAAKQIFLSPHLRKIIRDRLTSLNFKKIDEAERKLDEELKRELYTKYFKEDIAKLENYLEIDLDLWRI